MVVVLPDAAVRMRGVTRAYRSGSTVVRAIDEVSLDVNRRDAVAVTGPSGSGKTTLLNLMCGLDRPSAGEVTVFGERLDTASERALTAFRATHVGLVFQEPLLLPGLSALDNVVLARLPWERRSVLEKRSRELLAAVGLEQRLHHTPAHLSGGERQRVSIARALLGAPSLLLLDEPTGNLDATTTDEVLELLATLRADMELTLLVATHDPAVAAMADRVVRLVSGQVIEERGRSNPGIEIHEVL